MSCPPAARNSGATDTLLVLREKTERRVIRLASLHSHSGASSKEGDREREGGREERRGLMLLLLLLGKNDAAAVLGGCRQTERGGVMGGGGVGDEEGRREG